MTVKNTDSVEFVLRWTDKGDEKQHTKRLLGKEVY